MSLKVQQGAVRLQKFLDDANVPVAEKTPARIQTELQSISKELGLDAMEQNQACATALAQTRPDFAAQWVGQVAEAVGLSKVDLSNAIGDALGGLQNQPPLDKADFLAAMQQASAPAEAPPGARNLKASAIYAITGNTGPLATPIVTRRAGMSFKAKAGAHYRAVNLSAPDKNGDPGKVAAGKVSDKDLPPFQTEVPMRGANIGFKPGVSWMPGDYIAVYVKNPGEDEETRPAIIQLPTQKAPKAWTPNATRQPDVRPKNTEREGDVFKATGDYAVPAFATVRLSKNGVATALKAEADLQGRFSIDIPPGWEHDDIALTVDHATKPARIPIQNGRDTTGGADFLEEAKKTLLEQVQDFSAGVAFELDGFSPGYWVDIKAGDQHQRFAADDQGKLSIHLDPVPEGSAVAIKTKKVTVWEPGAWATPREQRDVFYPKFHPNPKSGNTGRWAERRLEIKSKVPSSPLAARRKAVSAALHDTTAHNVSFAMTLFGPNNQFPALANIDDPERIRTIFLGAQLGFVGNQKGPWFDAVRKHVVSLAEKKGLPAEQIKDLTDGMDVWKHHSGESRPGPDDMVRLYLASEGRESITITGGYSPISGSHGPLTPERTRTPDQHRLVLSGLDWLLPNGKDSSLTLKSGGRAPVGWVNTNAISMTIGMQTAG